jgi:hypothetical protein
MRPGFLNVTWPDELVVRFSAGLVSVCVKRALKSAASS